jgi:hypothetical protein
LRGHGQQIFSTVLLSVNLKFQLKLHANTGCTSPWLTPVKQSAHDFLCAPVGVTSKERRLLCEGADFEVADAFENLMNVGDPASIHVVLSGECAIYTMRYRSGTDSEAASTAPEEAELKAKFQSMQRRASVSIRAGPMTDPDTGEVHILPNSRHPARTHSHSLIVYRMFG